MYYFRPKKPPNPLPHPDPENRQLMHLVRTLFAEKHKKIFIEKFSSAKQ